MSEGKVFLFVCLFCFGGVFLVLTDDKSKKQRHAVFRVWQWPGICGDYENGTLYNCSKKLELYSLRVIKTFKPRSVID